MKVEAVPWGIGKHTLTRAYMLYLAHWAKKLSWKETAQSFHSYWEKVCQAVEYVVQWGLEHRQLGPIRAIGVDEIQYGRGHNYLTLVYQIEAGYTRLLWVGKERTRASFEQFFTLIGKELAEKIEFVCSDMWTPYLKMIEKHCVNALNILDRFQVVAKMNRAIDEVRSAEARRMTQDGYEPLLKKSRWCLLKPARISPTPSVSNCAICCATICRACGPIYSRRISSSSGTSTRPPGRAGSLISGTPRSCARGSNR